MYVVYQYFWAPIFMDLVKFKVSKISKFMDNGLINLSMQNVRCLDPENFPRGL